ncbi:MAG: hypothetical protein JW937_08435 [Candidatus Omnitrophica bacterium]|nr:hypothetical protein [Candidatus Omnitrophota bacterium]
MPYDASLDKELFAKTWKAEGTQLTIGVYSYNEGQKKLQIKREDINKEGETRFAKLGRLAKDEVEAILPFMQEALELLD